MPLSQASISDAEALHKCFKGIGMDEKTLIDILTHRNVAQILEIGLAYKANFGKDLHEKISSEASGNFGKLAKALAMHPAEWDAHLLNKAMSGVGTDEHLLIEVLMGRSNTEIAGIKAAYKNLYSKDLEEVVRGEVNGDLKKLFTVLLCGQRDEPGTARSVDEDVEALYKAGEGKIGTDEMKFIQIIGNRANDHITMVIRQYALKYGHDLTHAVKKEFGGDLEKALVCAVQSLQDRPAYFADLFDKAMKGLGTNEELLIRCLVRCRYPGVMGPVKEAFLKKHGKTLTHTIAKEVSGDFEKLACGLVDAAN